MFGFDFLLAFLDAAVECVTPCVYSDISVDDRRNKTLLTKFFHDV